MEQDVGEQQEACAIHQLMKAPPHAKKFARGGGFARQSSGTRTIHAPSGTAVIPLNKWKPIALATQANEYANTAMLHTSYRSWNAIRIFSKVNLTLYGVRTM